LLLQKLNELEEICFPFPYREDQLHSLLTIAKAICLFINKQGQITESYEQPCGYVLYIPLDDGIEILRIGILPEYRRKHLAWSFLQYLANTLSPGDRILLEVSSLNTAAMELYRKAGFQVLRKRASYYQDGSDALILEKKLLPN